MTQFFTLSAKEAESTRQALDVLAPLPWADVLLRQVVQGAGLTNENRRTDHS
jgi:hypothetical protein